MHVKKPTNACKETYSSTPLTDYRTNQRLLRTRICITFCAFTYVHGYMHRPRKIFFPLCIAYTDRLRKMLKPKNKYRASARAQHAFPAVHIHTHTHTHPSSPPQADSLPALYVFRNSRSSYCRASAALCVGAGRQTQWLCGAGERARGRDNDKLEVYIS